MQSFLRKLLAAAWLASGSACLKIPDELPEEPSEQHTAPTTAAELLSRFVQALGGETALRAIEQRTVEARIVRHKDEHCAEDDETCLREDQTGSFVVQNTAQGRMAQRVVLGDAVQERGFDGERGWSLSHNALRIDTPNEAVLTRDEALLHWYFDLEAREIEVTLLEPRSEDSEGRVVTLDGIRWDIRGIAAPKELWFDRGTGLLREEVTRTGSGDAASTQIILYDDYRSQDGVLVAHLARVIQQAGARKELIDFVTQRVDHAAIDAGKFAVPELAAPTPEPDPVLNELRRAEAAAKDPDADRGALVEWARLAFQAGHFDEAESAAKATLAADGGEPEALLILARVQLMAGRYAEATKSLERAEKAGVREDLIARERTWIHHRTRDYQGVARALDAAGKGDLAGRYRSFVGKPLALAFEGNACTVELELLETQPLLVVSATVGDRPLGLIFDTGAAPLIVTQTEAAALDVTIRARTRIAEGIPEIGHGQLDALSLGPVSLRNVPVEVFDDDSIAHMAGDHADRVGGVLGATALRELVIAVDVGEHSVSLTRRDGKCKAAAQALLTGAQATLWQHESHYFYVAARMNDAEGLYLINTGMRGADLTANPAAYAHAGIGVPTLRSDQTPMATVQRFELSPNIAFADLQAAFGLFQTTQTSSGFRLDGMIGLGTLGKRPFVLDLERQRIHFPPVTETAAPRASDGAAR